MPKQIAVIQICNEVFFLNCTDTQLDVSEISNDYLAHLVVAFCNNPSMYMVTRLDETQTIGSKHEVQ